MFHALIIVGNQAIKLIGVTERMKAVTTNLSSGQSPGTQPEGAKHGACFCSPGRSCLVYTSVAVQVLQIYFKRGTVCKNRDESNDLFVSVMLRAV